MADLPRYTELKRVPLRPSTRAIPRGAPPERKAPPKARKVPKRFAKRRDPEYCRWIRTLSCPFDRSRMRFEPPESEIGWILFHRDCSGPVECAHVKARACGGDDRGNTIPLCRGHHRQSHTIGIQTFQRRYGLDMAALAEQLAASYQSPPETAW